jgi:hypothetical protein
MLYPIALSIFVYDCLTQSEVLCCQRKHQVEEDAVFAVDLL